MPGGRHIVQEGGLEFLNVTDRDAGNYTCRAEVDEFGNYAERFISVAVNSASFSFFKKFLGPLFASIYSANTIIVTFPNIATSLPVLFFVVICYYDC